MNSKQRQFVLLTWLMAMLCIVLVFLFTYAPESPFNTGDTGNNITEEDPVENKNITRGFQLPGVFGDAYDGLAQLSKDFQSGVNAVSGESNSNSG